MVALFQFPVSFRLPQKPRLPSAETFVPLIMTCVAQTSSPRGGHCASLEPCAVIVTVDRSASGMVCRLAVPGGRGRDGSASLAAGTLEVAHFAEAHVTWKCKRQLLAEWKLHQNEKNIE